jgi:hypothetical protein
LSRECFRQQALPSSELAGTNIAEQKIVGKCWKLHFVLVQFLQKQFETVGTIPTGCVIVQLFRINPCTNVFALIMLRSEELMMSSQQSAILTCVACLMFACAVPRVLLGAPLDACSLLTPAEVNAALGLSTVPPKSTPARICRWGESGGQAGRRPAVVLTIQDAQAFNFAKAPSTSTNLVKTPVSGIGDDAVFNTIAGVTATLTVKKADTYFEVHVYGFPVDQTKTIEKTLAQEIAAKLK